MNIVQRIYLLKKISQLQDIKTLQGVNLYLFDQVSWSFINKITNILNNELFNFSKKTLNFQQITQRSGSISGSQYTGTLKNLVELSKWIYKVITQNRQNKPYSILDINKIINDFSTTLNGYSFPEPNAANIKSNILNIINEWKTNLPKK